MANQQLESVDKTGPGAAPSYGDAQWPQWFDDATAYRRRKKPPSSTEAVVAHQRSSLPPPQSLPPPSDDEELEAVDQEISDKYAVKDVTGAAGPATRIGTYRQLPMRAFLTQKDWRELLAKRDAGKMAKYKASGNKYHRMLYSYHKLYQEYQYLCTSFLPRSRCLDGGSGGGGDRDDEQAVAFESDTLEANLTNERARASTAAFGTVLMADRNFKVQRCKKRRNVVCHRVLAKSFDGTTVWLDVPIAVELLLPRLQEQIKAVMSACPHITDPLEVLAELRANRYDTERCVEYLRETLPLRKVVRDILSVRSSACGMDAEKTAGDRRDLLSRIAGLETQLRTAAAQLLLDDSDNNTDGGGGEEPLSGRVRRLVTSLDAVKVLLDAGASKSKKQRHHHRRRHHQEPKAQDQQQKASLQQQSQSEPQTQPPQPVSLPTVDDADATPPAEDGGGRPLLRGIRRLKSDLSIVHSSLRSVAAAMSAGLTKVRCHLSVQQERLQRLGKDSSTKQQATIARLQKYVEDLRIKCKEEEGRRRLVFNALQEQLGNIRVYCRCTRIDGEQAVETVSAESLRVRGQQQDEFFRFDRVFGVDAQQEALFDELRPLITSFLDGYNVCFITYGGEASGKTFTLLGSSKHRGLVYRALLAVLQETANRTADWSLELDSACLEIYNDACFDLLADRSAVALYKDCGLGSVFSALQRAPIREEKDVTSLLRASVARRRVAKTALNPKSSRSHLIHLVRLRAKSRLHGHTTCSYLGMMDLAGAENIVKADTWHEPDRTAEAGHINRSLAAFNRLFLTLRRTPPSAACYREARLTQMLKPFLVNHGKCCIIVTVRTDQASVSTTMSTLRFGRDARQVALGKAQRQLLTVDHQ